MNAAMDMDAIKTEVTHVRDWNGGSLYQIGWNGLVVLNGTYKEMGRQYGHLVKDKIIATRDGWKKVFIDSGVLEFESIHEVIGRPFYTSSPKTSASQAWASPAQSRHSTT